MTFQASFYTKNSIPIIAWTLKGLAQFAVYTVQIYILLFSIQNAPIFGQTTESLYFFRVCQGSNRPRKTTWLNLLSGVVTYILGMKIK